MIIDAHQHFWEPARFHYPWMTPEVAVLARDYLPGDLAGILADLGIDRTVVVQATHSEEETRWLLELAEKQAFIAGVVGWVDFTSPRLRVSLEEFAGRRKFVGLRHQVHDETDPEWLLRPDVLNGLALLSRFGLPYDLLVRAPHLRRVQLLAQRLPDLRMVIDHIAKPPIARREFDEWAQAMRPLAAHANLYCKLSGMVTEAEWSNWKPRDLEPYARYVLDLFGPERVMFGSDWPVCLLAGSYRSVWETAHALLDGFDASAQQKVFGGTATAFYRLPA